MAKGPAQPRSVLVIDDDPLMRELLTALLEIEGATVHAAESGSEALAWLATEDAEIVLTDLQMPDTDIIHLAPKLRESRGSDALLLGMSGSPAEEAELALLDGFVLKPFSTEEFFAAAETAKRNETSVPGLLGDSALGGVGEHAASVLDMKIYGRMAASLKPGALGELYRITLEDVRHRASVMRDAYARSDHETCRQEAHAIKGGCGMVGAMELRAEAEALESGAPADTRALAKLEEACNRLKRMLDAPPLITFGAS